MMNFFYYFRFAYNLAFAYLLQDETHVCMSGKEGHERKENGEMGVHTTDGINNNKARYMSLISLFFCIRNA